MKNVDIEKIIQENNRRLSVISSFYDPVTGEGCDGKERVLLHLPDAPVAKQYIPAKMVEEIELIRQLLCSDSIGDYVEHTFGQPDSKDLCEQIWRKVLEVRIRYDFEFWAAMFVVIKDKLSDCDVPFILNRPQRRLLCEFEKMREQGKPIRAILLKARQWGGSTFVQMYMAWIQLVHRNNWNSVICAHLKDSAANIKGMYSKLLENYPSWLLGSNEPIKFQPYERMANTSVIKQTGCRVTIGSAETPESIRGADAVMAHLSEVAFWPRTRQKSPEQLIRSVCGSVALLPYSVVVLESTANGTGNYFHRECERAKRGASDKLFVFVPWYEIDIYSCPVDDYAGFIKTWDAYEQFLWERGATLEAIYWYRQKRKEYPEHADMMAEYPSDDIEAFTYSGERVFDVKQVQRLRKNCVDPDFTGEIYGQAMHGKEALCDLKFSAEPGGKLSVWSMPAENANVRNRYITVVDIGGRSVKADYSVIVVFDRYWMMFGGIPEVVAQWRGHTDHDLLAWKAVQIASFYHRALLVIESNTLETENTDGEHAEYILDTIATVYDRLYARAPSGQIRAVSPSRWGFHMNRSTKTLIINHQINMLREEGYIERDILACYEHDVFEKKPNGSFGAMDGHHDDILITRCIGNYVCYTEPLPAFIKEKEKKTDVSHVPLSEASF